MRILIAMDMTPNGGAAVRVAALRPWPSRSEFRVISVIETSRFVYPIGSEYLATEEPMSLFPKTRDAVEKKIVCASKLLTKNGSLVSHTIRLGNPPDEIIAEAAEWKADLIMLGTHSRRPLTSLLLGSVGQRVAATAPCSVEVVREQSSEKPAEKSPSKSKQKT